MSAMFAKILPHLLLDVFIGRVTPAKQFENLYPECPNERHANHEYPFSWCKCNCLEQVLDPWYECCKYNEDKRCRSPDNHEPIGEEAQPEERFSLRTQIDCQEDMTK
jgi:hypothetical protein